MKPTWLYLTVAAVQGALLLLLAYQSFTQPVFPWGLLTLVVVVSLALFFLVTLGDIVSSQPNPADMRASMRRVLVMLVLLNSALIAVMIAYDIWFGSGQSWEFNLSYGLGYVIIGFVLVFRKYFRSAQRR